MNKKDNRRSKNITDLLKAIGNSWVFDIEFPQYVGRASFPGGPPRLSEEQLQKIWNKQRIAYLKKKKWIKTKKIEKRLMLALTDKGKMELKRRSMKSRPKLPKGQLCIVIWDIPEASRKARNRFRYFLKRSEFSQLQLSVWISDRDVVSNVVEFIKEAKIKKWVNVFVGKKKI